MGPGYSVQDFHPLDSIERFHLLKLGSPSPKLFPARHLVSFQSWRFGVFRALWGMVGSRSCNAICNGNAAQTWCMGGNMENELVTNDGSCRSTQADCICGIPGYEDVGGFIQLAPVQMRLLAEGFSCFVQSGCRA